MSDKVLIQLENYFGIESATLENLVTINIGNETYIMNKEVATFRQLKVYRRGIKLAQSFTNSVKFATAAIQLFGKFAQKNTLPVSYSEAMMFAQGQEFSPHNQPNDPKNGLVIVKYKQFPIGIGNYKEGKLKSAIPRSQVARFGARRRKFKPKRR